MIIDRTNRKQKTDYRERIDGTNLLSAKIYKESFEKESKGLNFEEEAKEHRSCTCWHNEAMQTLTISLIPNVAYSAAPTMHINDYSISRTETKFG